MNGSLAIVAYRAKVAGVLTGLLDFQVRWFSTSDPEEVRRFIRSEPSCKYLNESGESVSWELAEIMAVDAYPQHDSGDEIIGFVANIDELIGLAEPR